MRLENSTFTTGNVAIGLQYFWEVTIPQLKILQDHKLQMPYDDRGIDRRRSIKITKGAGPLEYHVEDYRGMEKLGERTFKESEVVQGLLNNTPYRTPKTQEIFNPPATK
ncbi:hypothetical protein HYT24_03520 [Candidatus Pacearchaeota archaeon]|nr:hypothetical protein [Candidatus Pacearchaeota archaeon]